MAARGQSRTRDFDYSNIGKAGRRTGVTLREGKLDENGMEELDGMFSSPDKSPAGNDNTTITRSEDMETGDSSVLDPTQLLSERRRNGYVPPPRSRSPRKTFMSGTPRRTPVYSSPLPQNNDSSPLTSAHVSRNNTARQSLATNGGTAGKGPAQTANQEFEDTADFSDEGNFNEDIQFYEATGRVSEEGDTQNTEQQDEGQENTTINQSEVHEGLDGQEKGPDGQEEQGEQEDDQEWARGNEETSAREKTAYPEHRSREHGTRNGQREPKASTSKQVAPSERRKRGRPRKSDPPKPQASFRTAAEEYDSGDGELPEERGGQGDAAEMDSADDPDRDQRATKRQKTASRPCGPELSAEQEKELNHVVQKITKNGRKPRSLYILKHERPAEQPHTTRSGRPSVRPLAYWRNERCVYGDGETEVGTRYPLSTITEIIRTEDDDSVPDRREKRSGRKGKKDMKGRGRRWELDALSDDETNVYAEPWEQGDGVFYGPVKRWDSERNVSTHEEEIMDIAYAPSAVQTHEVKDSTFRFAKILSTPFLGSGFVDMPPGSVKRQKNSKRMHMVFFVYHGRIQVDVSGLRFSAGKGCVFQVPRGNIYSFSNEFNHPAAIFFTQGCVPPTTEDSARGGDGSGGGAVDAAAEVPPPVVGNGPALQARGQGHQPANSQKQQRGNEQQVVDKAEKRGKPTNSKKRGRPKGSMNKRT